MIFDASLIIAGGPVLPLELTAERSPPVRHRPVFPTSLYFSYTNLGVSPYLF